MEIILFSGFLGSGKTTILLELTQYLTSLYPSQAGYPTVAIIENEIGEIGVDDKLLSSKGFKVENLSSGCICCTMVSDLVTCLKDLVKQESLQWIVIEATGLAYSESVARTIQQYLHLQPKTVVVVDAERWEELTEIVQPLIYGQIKGADIVLINKIQDQNSRQEEKIKTEIFSLNSVAKVFCISMNENVEEFILEAIIDA